MLKVQKIVISLVAVVGLMSLFSTTALAADKYVVYVQDGCVHCQNLEAFVTRNNLNDNIEYKNIRTSAAAEQEITALFTKYNQPDQAGTPAMDGDGKLLAGDTPIIDFLKAKYNVVDDTPTSTTTTTTDTVKKPLSTGDIALLGLGGLVLVFVVGYGIYSSVKKD